MRMMERLVAAGGHLPAALAGLAAAAMLAFALPSAAAQPLVVDFTVHETIPLTEGKIVRGHLEDCDSARVRTIHAGSSASGGVTTFNGSKRIDCGSGNTLTLAFSVRTADCQKTDAGTWKVTRGTGLFAAARGQGKLVGTYTLGTRPSPSCERDGIDDHYTGKLQY